MHILLFFTETQYWIEFNTLIDACRRNYPSTSVLIVWESFDFDKIPWEISYYTQNKNRAAVNIGENSLGRKIIWIRNFVAFSRFLKHLFLRKSGGKCYSPVWFTLLGVILRSHHKKLGLFILLHLQYDD